MRARSGVRRGFTRFSDRVGSRSTAPSIAKITSSWVAPADGFVTGYLWGRGGAGDPNGPYAGASGGASRKRAFVASGETIQLVEDSSAIIMTFPDGASFRATHGSSSVAGSSQAPTPGQGIGGDVNVAGLAPASTGGANPVGFAEFPAVGSGGQSGSRNDENPSQPGQLPSGPGTGFGSGGGSRGQFNGGSAGAPSAAFVVFNKEAT